MKKIFLATKNKGKIKEIKKILDEIDDLEVLSILDGIEIPEVEETGLTFEENSVIKAIEIAKYTGMFVIADDSGISVEALNGRPGVYSARYAGVNATDEDNNNKLIEELKNIDNRKAKYEAVITIASPNLNYKSFYGFVDGKIVDKPQGKNGFGYDPYFYKDEYNMTFGELDENIKNKISHRAMALDKLKLEIKKFLL
ncbi:MAG: XTP/dITP diphosphatase [Fusobacteria bacterium]|nr:XTP/dITP diphosphatase [Fusobacteriota bacterium]